VSTSSLPNLLADFEKELEDIFDDLSKDGPSEPKPEKW
jgi:hypothetical protein